MEYAVKIQPFRSKVDFDVLASVLDMPGGDPGGATQCFNVSYNGPDQTFKPTFPVASDPANLGFYVDAAKGSDAGKGTLDSPFQTIEKALAASRATPRVAASIVLRAGVYGAKDTLNLGASDSYLTIQNFQGEEVWLSGAKTLTTKWVSGASDHPSQDKNIFKTDLSGQHVTAITGLRINRQRAVRARYPNGCSSDQKLPSGYLCQGNMTDGKVVDPNDGFGSNLITEWIKPTAPNMSQAGWREVNPATPLRDTGLSFQKFQLGVGGTCGSDPMLGGVGFDPPAGYWCGNACEGGAPRPPGCIARWPRGLLYNRSILPNAPYKNPTTGVVQAWHPGHWASWMFEVVKENDKGETSDTQLMFGRGGFQGARGSYGNSGLPASTGRMADAFFVENIFEELDADNEFFYDADTQTLYYYSSKGAPSGVVEATDLKTFISIQGTQASPVRGVRLLGLGFRDTALSYLDNHSMPSGGDWGLGRIAAVFVKGAVDTVIDRVTMQQLDGNAIMVNGYARGTVIQNSNFHEIGDNIIAQLGETQGAGPNAEGMGPDGTAGTQPVGTVVKNNFAYRCGLFEKQSSFYFQAKSRGNIIENNIFFHGPRAGMNFNDGFGGGSRVAGNLMFSTVMESGDHGPFNSWDRQVWSWIDDDTGKPTVVKKYDEISGNFFIGNYYGQEAIDNDDGSAYYNTHHNFFAYAGTGMKNDFNGHDNHHHDNLYAYIGLGLGICGNLPGHEDKFYNNRVIQLGSGGYARYDCSCTKSKACPQLHDNTIYTPDGKMGKVCNQDLPTRQHEGVDIGTSVRAHPSDEIVISWARELLDLPTR